jgi:hypothetical protein
MQLGVMGIGKVTLECGGKRSATPLSHLAVFLRSIRQYHHQSRRRRALLAAALYNVPPRLPNIVVNGHVLGLKSTWFMIVRSRAAR